MFIVYKTSNLINNHYYIGVHKQSGTSFDGYYGSGVGLKRAIEKYGKKNFVRETLFSFIDYVIIFNDNTPLSMIRQIRPNIIVKGGDYNANDIIGKEYCDEVLIFNYIENKSSTSIINKIKYIK